MANPEVAVYAGDPLNPGNIWDNLQQIKISRWTTIILSFLHFSPDCAMMAFNNLPIMNVGVLMDWAADWNNPLSQMLEGSTVEKIYASFGGGPPVEDFTRLKSVYEFYGKTFIGTPVDYNLQSLRKDIPSITGIDMDIEEGWDEESFVAFCQLVVSLGYEISFSVYGDFDAKYTKCPFYIDCLKKIEESSWGKGAVKRFNLQTYWGLGSAPDRVEYLRHRHSIKAVPLAALKRFQLLQICSTKKQTPCLMMWASLVAARCYAAVENDA